MAAYWCTWCNKKKSKWITDNHKGSELWTLQTMTEEQESEEDQRGCVDVPLFDCVPILLYVFPILYVMIGVSNKVLNDFFLWVN